VRERRIPKAIKPEDEESPDKGSQSKEASVILRRKIRRIHNEFSKTTEELEIIITLVHKILEVTLDY
jgi:hypothetical protein